MIETFANWSAAVATGFAAVLWYRASVVSVDAPNETAGVGALPGGYLISKVGDKRIDLHATLDKQSDMNAGAARAACVAAALGGLGLIAKALGMP